MRIVDVCAFYSPQGGGVKTYVERKLRAGAAAGHEIIILAPGTETGTVQRIGDGSGVVSLSSPRFPLDRRYGYFDDEAALHDMLDRLNPDVVEVSSPWSSASMVANWKGRAPRVLVMHADPLASYAYRWFRPLASRQTIDQVFGRFWRHLRTLDRNFDLVVSASDSLTDRMAEGGLEKVVTLPMGVEPGIFSPAHRDLDLRARLLELCGLPPEATLLLGAGRLAPEKRWPMVIDAVTAAAYHRPIGMVLLGDGRDRARVVRAIGNNPHIRLLAPVTDRPALASIFASADALVHGCESETFCMVGAEARASGLPVIMPNLGGASDHLRGWVGEGYEAADGSSMSAAILRLADRLGDPLPEPNVATMDQHFDRLFAMFEGLTQAGQPQRVRG